MNGKIWIREEKMKTFGKMEWISHYYHFIYGGENLILERWENWIFGRTRTEICLEFNVGCQFDWISF